MSAGDEAMGEDPTMASDRVRVSGDDATQMSHRKAEAAVSGSDSTQASDHLTAERRGELPAGAQRYTLGRTLGRGGMGVVLEAQDRQFGRSVAIKRLYPDASAAARQRFDSEAQITGVLAHAGIPSVHERGQLADGTPFYAMQKIDGRTLGAALEQATTPRDRLALLPALVRVAQTIAYAHDHGVVHRDLKPDNVIIDRHGQVVVLDWGLAKARGTSVADRLREQSAPAGPADLTYDGDVLGTPAYMAPEQAEGRIDDIDARSDVFGLGALLYQVLTGAPPFAAPSSAEALALATEARYSPIRERNPKAPARLVSICERALARDPEARFATAGAFADALESYTEDAVSSTTDRVADVLSAAVGAIAGIVAVGLVALLALGTRLLEMLGPVGAIFMTLTVIGCILSALDWYTRARFRLTPLALALALATGAIGFGHYAIGMAEVHERALGVTDAAKHQQIIDSGNVIAQSSLAFGAFLCGLQLLLWGVARRRSLQRGSG